MTAIRAKRHKVAEYLIDQLAINVNHTTELIEFRAQTKIPIRERILSCRDLAYDKGLMDLVDLIDIASDDVKPSIKRYLQRRLKKRLDEIHEAYLKRMKERSHRLIIQSEKKNSEIQELSDEQEKENEELPNINIPDDNSSPPPPPPPMPVIIHRPYKSHINETIQNIASKNDLSIDESGKKVFRFSGYTLRYRLVETGNTNQQMNNEQSQFKSTPFLFPFTPSITTTRPLPRTFSRPATTATATNHNRRSISEIGTRIPIRETRTSICRSARRISTARAAPTVIPEVKPTINTTPRLLTKRIPQSNRTYGYIPQIQNALYNEPRHFRPITLKATAIGLSANTRLLRD